MVYLDDTWANERDNKGKAWVEKDDTISDTVGGIQRPPSKGSCSSVSMQDQRPNCASDSDQ